VPLRGLLSTENRNVVPQDDGYKDRGWGAVGEQKTILKMTVAVKNNTGIFFLFL
jgi:hypothetical protein